MELRGETACSQRLKMSRDDIFDSRASLDIVFQSIAMDSTESVDVLVVGFDDGTIHLNLYDFFQIGSFNLQQAFSSLQRIKPLSHCSHPFSTTHSLIVSSSSRESLLFVVPLDLRLVSNAGRYLSVLASKSTQMHNILRYLHLVCKELCNELQSSQELPRKFISNVEDTLKKKDDCTWVQAAYHLVVTGDCFPGVKDWLVDELGERVDRNRPPPLVNLLTDEQGYKRWEKVASHGYESIRRLVHENLLPALERFCVLVSRLRGLSKFQEPNTRLGLSTHELENILDTTNCLQLLAHHILICAGSEFRQFLAFSTWLRKEIEIQSIDNSSSMNDPNEKEPEIDYVSTLGYIQGGMMNSRLNMYLNTKVPADKKSQWDLAAKGRSLYDLYKHELKERCDEVSAQKNLPGLDTLIAHLDIQCTSVFAGIAETQRRNIRFGSLVSLGKGTPACMDVRMLAEVR